MNNRPSKDVKPSLQDQSSPSRRRARWSPYALEPPREPCPIAPREPSPSFKAAEQQRTHPISHRSFIRPSFTNPQVHEHHPPWLFPRSRAHMRSTQHTIPVSASSSARPPPSNAPIYGDSPIHLGQHIPVSSEARYSNAPAADTGLSRVGTTPARPSFYMLRAASMPTHTDLANVSQPNYARNQTGVPSESHSNDSPLSILNLIHPTSESMTPTPVQVPDSTSPLPTQKETNLFSEAPVTADTATSSRDQVMARLRSKLTERIHAKRARE